MLFDVYPIDTLHVNDNYAWAIVPAHTDDAFVVDPGEAAAVSQWLQETGRRLAGVLITHRHWDHVGGIPGLCALYDVPFWGPDIDAMPPQATIVSEGDRLEVGGIALEVWAVPGHTRDHIAYVHRTEQACALFCGDTLFASGCGRVFEGEAAGLYHSLSRYTQLPLNTQIFCAHEYTLRNLAFAQAVEPHNAAIAARQKVVKAQREQGLPSLPTQLDVELAANPFLRCHHPDVIQQVERHVGRELAPGAEVFAALRRWKDEFR